MFDFEVPEFEKILALPILEHISKKKNPSRYYVILLCIIKIIVLEVVSELFGNRFRINFDVD